MADMPPRGLADVIAASAAVSDIDGRAGELAAASGDDAFYRMSRRMEEVVLAEKGLLPNVDFYAGLTWVTVGQR